MDPHVWQVMVDAFPQLLFKGITVTIPLTIISFALSMVIAVVVALIQYSKVPVLRQICRFYVWVIRGTPLLVQLYVVFFGLPSIGIMVDAFLAAVIVSQSTKAPIRRNDSRRVRVSSSGPDGSRTLRRPQLFSDHVARRSASGL